jgi:hypothetical protein
MSASIKSNSSGNLELYSGATKVLEANAGTGVVSGLKVAAGSGAGQAVNYDQVIGVGQTWQDVTASRSAGVTYTNTTGKPIEVCVIALSTINPPTVKITVDGVGEIWGGHATGNTCGATIIVPNGSGYVVGLGSNTSVSKWMELR